MPFIALALAVATSAANPTRPVDPHTTKSGYFACPSRHDFETFMHHIIDEDQKAALSMVDDGSCIALKGGVRVDIEDTAIHSGLVKIRVHGTRVTVWTNVEAVK